MNSPTPIPRLPALQEMFRALAWPRLMQLGLAFFLGVLTLLLGQYTWQRVGEPARPTLSIETTFYRIDINGASAGELEQLPGIGPALARQIVGYRDASGPFNRVDDLERVPGIGPALLDRVRARVFAGTSPVAPARLASREPMISPGATSHKPPPGEPLDLNQASREELMKLPGIGPVLAERIIADRRERGPFRRVEDVTRVSGIKSKMLEKLRPHVRVAGDTLAGLDGP